MTPAVASPTQEKPPPARTGPYAVCPRTPYPARAAGYSAQGPQPRRALTESGPGPVRTGAVTEPSPAARQPNRPGRYETTTCHGLHGLVAFPGRRDHRSAGELVDPEARASGATRPATSPSGPRRPRRSPSRVSRRLRRRRAAAGRSPVPPSCATPGIRPGPPPGHGRGAQRQRGEQRHHSAQRIRRGRPQEHRAHRGASRGSDPFPTPAARPLAGR